MPHSPRQRALTSALAVAAATALLAACSSPSGTTKTNAPASASATPSAAAAAPKASCPSGSDPAKQFKLGTFLPLTGSLAYLGPAAVAGSGLAVDDINAAGGVKGQKACIISTDSSDADNATVGSTNVKKLLQSKVSAILGAESSSVTLNVLPTVSASKTVMFSPANTADELSGASPYYFRDAPPNSVEGNALGKQIAADGFTKTAILVFNDPYGTNLRDATQKALEASGGSVVYGAKGKNQEFPAKETNFSSAVSAAKATNPDSYIVIAFDQTKQIIPKMVSAGVKLNSTYFVDGNLADYSKDFPKNTLSGVTGSTQGVNPQPDFKKRSQTWYSSNGGSTIGAFGYGPESYDGVVLMALAAEKGSDTSAASIQKNLLAVSGASGGTVCKTYKDCLALLKAKKPIHYQGLSATGPLNAKHDPSTGFISIYKFDADNKPSKFVNSVKG